MMTDLVTIEGVEIGSVGMNWPASNGDFTITFEHLQDVMRAANDDPHIITPRLKLGHEGWPDMDGTDNSPFGTSAEPALGYVENFRLTNDGATLVGDYVDVPAWLLAAYRSRSGEWIGNGQPQLSQGVTTPGGKNYTLVLTAVALLGVAAPAIQDLDDLESFLTTGATKHGSFAVVATQEGTMPAVVETSASIDAVQRSFWSEFAEEGTAYYWWWPRDFYVDPNQVVADDDEGHLFRVPFSTDADGNVTWGEPVPIRMDLVDLPDATPTAVATAYRAVAATAAATHRTFATAAAARPAERHTQRSAEHVAAVSTAGSSGLNDQEDEAMTGIDIPALRTRLGLTDEQLPDDATPEQINAAFAAETPPDPTPDPEPDPDPDTDPAAENDEIVRLDRGAYEELREGALAGTAAREHQVRSERDSIIATAVREGRIPPSRHDYWRQQLDVDTEGATVLLTASADKGGLAPGSVSTSERGTDVVATAIPTDGALPEGVSLLTPAERAERDRRAA